MEKKEESKKAWSNFNKNKSSYEYSKAPLQSIEDAQYIQGVSFNSRQYGIEDFKLALKAEIEKEIKNSKEMERDDEYISALYNSLSLIDEIKPLEK